MKAALCFIISYENALIKESIWRRWIHPNKDIINVYFHYKKGVPIRSEWIKSHLIDEKYLVEIDYMHIAPAYLSLLFFGLKDDPSNEWFCFLTESCVPIVSPLEFRERFLDHHKSSIMSWKPAWWSTALVKRANLQYFEPKYHLSNTPWFTLCRSDAHKCIMYWKKNRNIYNVICLGEVANESLFAIMLLAQNSLEKVINEQSTLMDWARMTSLTSPYVFKDANPKDLKYIDDALAKNKFALFLRKVDKTFPDSTIEAYLEEKCDHLALITKKKRIFWKYLALKSRMYGWSFLLFVRRFCLFIVIGIIVGSFVDAFVRLT
jgi:hypothetical protein